MGGVLSAAACRRDSPIPLPTLPPSLWNNPPRQGRLLQAITAWGPGDLEEGRMGVTLEAREPKVPSGVWA